STALKTAGKDLGRESRGFGRTDPKIFFLPSRTLLRSCSPRPISRAFVNAQTAFFIFWIRAKRPTALGAACGCVAIGLRLLLMPQSTAAKPSDGIAKRLAAAGSSVFAHQQSIDR